MHTPLELQTPDWQYAEAVAGVQPAAPVTAPHEPLAPQTLLTHMAAEVQDVPFVVAQVFSAVLQALVAQTALAFEGEHVPSCRVSVGMAWPAARPSRPIPCT